MTDSIQKEIKEALQARTQEAYRGVQYWKNADIYLAINAPTWLLHQQELIELKDAEIAQLKDQRNRAIAELGKTMEDAEIIEKENKQLREQLEHAKLTPIQKMSRSIDILSQLGEQKS
jgi:hypothetical protein